MKIFAFSKQFFILFMDAPQSQEFDMHREYWDYFNDNSTRSVQFYQDPFENDGTSPLPQPHSLVDDLDKKSHGLEDPEDLFNDPDQIIELLDSIEENELRPEPAPVETPVEKVEVVKKQKKVPQSSTEIFEYMYNQGLAYRK